MKPAIIRTIALIAIAAIIMVLSYQYGKKQGTTDITPTNLPTPTMVAQPEKEPPATTSGEIATASASPTASIKPSASPISFIKMPKVTLKPVTMATPTPTPSPTVTVNPAAIQKLQIQKVPSF